MQSREKFTRNLNFNNSTSLVLFSVFIILCVPSLTRIYSRSKVITNYQCMIGHTDIKKGIMMILLFTSIIIFNFVALKFHKIPVKSRIVSIWTFTIAFQVLFDLIIEFKFHGYWYFDKGIEVLGFLAHTVLIPPVNVLLLSFYPYNKNLFKQSFYMIGCTVGIMIYEAISLLPEPWGFFHLGWWNIWYDLFVVPILIFILLGYYKWICKLETV